MNTPKIVCMTPIKNEEWILERFIRCASVWADHIIIADQGSDDASREIASSFPKVTLIENKSSSYNELERQKLLIGEARKIEGPKVLVALDADEFFTSEFLESNEWRDAKSSVPGTVLYFKWACVLPDQKTYYEYPADFPFGYVDDGADHKQGEVIHSPRVPVLDDAPKKYLGTQVLHLSVLDSHRFSSKIRWYQAWEFLNNNWGQRYLELYRNYHRDEHINPSRVTALPGEWVDGYGEDIGLLDNDQQPYYRWDKEMLAIFDEHGTEKFRRLNIWTVDWNQMYQTIYNETPGKRYDDPRTWIEKWVHRWMYQTQKYYSPDPPPRSRIRRKLHQIATRLVLKLGW